jgi:hypothetical protein
MCSLKLTPGLEKDEAQKQFITEAQKMGIPSVDWEGSYQPPAVTSQDICGWPRKAVPGGHVKKACHLTRKLLSRSEMLMTSAISGTECDENTYMDKASKGISLWNGLALLSQLCLSLWTVVQRRMNLPGDGGRPRIGKVHARAWNRM